jgi:predicted small integral membrane protein
MQSIGAEYGIIVRACKVALVGVVGLLMTLIAIGNITDYGTNALFVRHVLAMDTIFPDSTLRWRAIADPTLQTAAYDTIIVWESLCAIVIAGAVVRLTRSVRDPHRFGREIATAVVGLTMVLFLFGGGFLTIGSEWFLMWQSKTWNGNESALRYFLIAGVTLLIISSERADARLIDDR